MANGFREIIEINPEPGPVCAIRGLLSAGACAAVGLSDITLWHAVACLSAIGLVMALDHRLGEPRVTRAVLLPDGHWNLFLLTAEPTSARLVSGWGESLGPLIGLEWECSKGRRHRAWLLMGVLPDDHWRRLRVRLRLS